MTAFDDSNGFAKRILRSQGWKEGDGLGKNRDGIVIPIKPSLKFDTRGVGHDPGKEFSHHWWSVAYDEAVKRIEVTPNGEDTVEIKTKKKSKKSRKVDKKEKRKNMYAGFVMAATLTEGKLVENTDKPKKETAKPNEDSLTILSDEELLKACGGLTAHKGARHGHNMSAKYKRLEEMDKRLMARICAKKKNKESPTD